MAELTWRQLKEASVLDRAAALGGCPAVREPLLRSLEAARAVLVGSGFDDSEVWDLHGAAMALALAVARSSVWMRVGDSQSHAKVEVPTKPNALTWLGIALTDRRDPEGGFKLSFAEMWGHVASGGIERRQYGGLSWLDEFVLEASCCGWRVRAPQPSDGTVPSNAVIAAPRATPPKAVRRWLVGRYDQYLQKLLCERSVRSMWEREFASSSEASSDFWGFHTVARWGPDAIVRARYLGHCAYTTYLFDQVRAWTTARVRSEPRYTLSGGDELQQTAAGPQVARSTSAYIDIAYQCIERHKGDFGLELQRWIEAMLRLCPLVIAGANLPWTTPDRPPRVPDATWYHRLKGFRRAVEQCIAEQCDLTIATPAGAAR